MAGAAANVTYAGSVRFIRGYGCALRVGSHGEEARRIDALRGLSRAGCWPGCGRIPCARVACRVAMIAG